jgi:hypothetical protein
VTGPGRPPLAWVASLDQQDRAAFYDDLAAAVAAAREADDHEVVEECLRQWRLTAEGMTNAELRDSLLE